MKTGYYKNNPNLDFDSLANDFIREFDELKGDQFNFTFSANDMLHGFCDIFAEILAKEFNPDYKVYSLLSSSDGYLVHCYCMFFDNDKKYYVDIRGITDDFEEFISEFSDFIETEDEQELLNAELIVPWNFNLAKQNRDYMMGTTFEKELVKISKEIINSQKDFYNPEQLKEQEEIEVER